MIAKFAHLEFILFTRPSKSDFYEIIKFELTPRGMDFNALLDIALLFPFFKIFSLGLRWRLI